MTVGPTIYAGPAGSGRYAIPDYSPITRGLTSLGAGLSQGLDRAQMAKEKAARDASLGEALAGLGVSPAVPGNPMGPAGTEPVHAPAPAGPDMGKLWQAIGSNPDVLADPRFGAAIGLAQMGQPGEPKERKTIEQDGRHYYMDTGEPVLPNVERPAPDPVERFETVQNPYGRGGVGQRSTVSGKITGYQAPQAALETGPKWESITDEAGNPIAQRNLETGEVKADPRASKRDQFGTFTHRKGCA